MDQTVKLPTEFGEIEQLINCQSWNLSSSSEKEIDSLKKNLQRTQEAVLILKKICQDLYIENQKAKD